MRSAGKRVQGASLIAAFIAIGCAITQFIGLPWGLVWAIAIAAVIYVGDEIGAGSS